MLGLFFTFSDKKYLNKLVDEVVIGCREITRDSSPDFKTKIFKNFLLNKYRVNKNKSIKLDVIRREIEDELEDQLEKGAAPTILSFIYMIVAHEKYGLQVISTTQEVVESRLKDLKVDW